MPLSAEEKKQLLEAAAQEGVDPEELVRVAEEMAAGQAVGDRAEPAAAADPPKIFQYHLPFMKVSEIRSSIGLTASIGDDEMPAGEWLAKHGGALAKGQ